MRYGARAVAILALTAALAACGGQKQEEQPAGDTAPTAEIAAADASPADKPPVAFAQCMSCHTVEPGKHTIGPSLHGVVGRPAGSVAGYAYSPALKASGLTWDEATLDKWIEAPAKLVPGTKMAFFGMPDPAKRKQLIDWLATQK